MAEHVSVIFQLARDEVEARFASIEALFADRSDGVDSINRYTEDAQGTTTNACFIARPSTREIRACRGPADRGEWQTLAFERG